jgi:hypothetical protein
MIDLARASRRNFRALSHETGSKPTDDAPSLVLTAFKAALFKAASGEFGSSEADLPIQPIVGECLHLAVAVREAIDPA